jgi:hypothetical protein
MADTKHHTAVERFLGKAAPRHEPEVEEALAREAFEEVRAPKPRGRESISLDVRLASGRCSGFSYAYLVWADYVPSDVITLHLAQSAIVIEGRRLTDLYRRLLDHRVESVQEGTESEEGLKPDAAAHIDRITIINREEATE